MKVQCMLLQTNEKQNNTSTQKKNLPRTVFKNIAYKKGGKNINDVKKLKQKKSEMLVHSQLANKNICFFSI